MRFPTRPTRALPALALAAGLEATLLLSGCLAPPRRAPAPPARPSPVPAAARERGGSLAGPIGVPTATPPASRLTESALGEGEPTPAEPAPTQSAELPSLVSRINSSTPPNVAAALRLIEEGRALLAEQAYDGALDRFERAVTIDPSNAYGYFFLAKLHYDKHDYDQVIAFADKAIVLSTRGDAGLAARAYSLQGAVYEEVGRYADARAAYRKALSADAQNLAAQVGITRLGGDSAAP